MLGQVDAARAAGLIAAVDEKPAAAEGLGGCEGVNSNSIAPPASGKTWHHPSVYPVVVQLRRVDPVDACGDGALAT